MSKSKIIFLLIAVVVVLLVILFLRKKLQEQLRQPPVPNLGADFNWIDYSSAEEEQQYAPVTNNNPFAAGFDFSKLAQAAASYSQAATPDLPGTDNY